jgi:hypothetical protein
MEKRKAIEEILFHDYGRIDETTVDKIMLLFYNTKKNEQLPHPDCDESCYYHCTKGGTQIPPDCVK